LKENPRREHILRAGSECFARFGFDKTTLEDIGRRAGLNKASLYYYFKNKEEIFIAVVLAETGAFTADLQSKTLAFPDVRKQLRYYLTERIRRYREVAHLMRLSADGLQHLGTSFDEATRKIKEKEMAFLTDLVRKAALESALAVQEPSASLAEHFFLLSDAFKHDATRAAGPFGSGDFDFEPAIAQVDYWVKILLR